MLCTLKSKRLSVTLIRKLKYAAWAASYLFMWFLAHGLFRRVFERDILTWDPDVIHGHDNLSLPLLVSAAKRLHAVAIFDSHELETHRNHPLIGAMRNRIAAIETRAFPQLDATLTVSEKISQRLAAEYNITPPTILYNAPPLDADPLPPRWQGPVRDSIRHEAGISSDALVLVYTGNISDGRGIQQSISYLAQYLAQDADRPDLHLSLVGAVTNGFRRQLQDQARQLGIQNRIHFHSSVPPTAVVDFIADADIALLPILPLTLSYQYAMPNKLFEALHAGLPILGAELEEMGPFILQNHLGAVYDPYSAKAFSKALDDILSHKSQTPKHRARAQLLSKRYCWEAQEDKLLALYRTLAPHEKHPRVAMVVPNPCDPDFRVVKQAQSLSKAGYQVRVYCTQPATQKLPDLEIINGVEYRRIEWSPRAFLTPRWFRSLG